MAVRRAEFRPRISQHQPLQQAGYPGVAGGVFRRAQGQGRSSGDPADPCLDGWDDLDSLLQRWSELSAAQHSAILQACGQLARQLHGVRQVHGCFYPKHIFAG
jgi:hypothetical protein